MGQVLVVHCPIFAREGEGDRTSKCQKIEGMARQARQFFHGLWADEHGECPSVHRHKTGSAGGPKGKPFFLKLVSEFLEQLFPPRLAFIILDAFWRESINDTEDAIALFRRDNDYFEGVRGSTKDTADLLATFDRVKHIDGEAFSETYDEDVPARQGERDVCGLFFQFPVIAFVTYSDNGRLPRRMLHRI